MSDDSISVSDLARLHGSGRPLTLIDVRTPAEYARVHATGAVLVPLDQLDPAAVSALRNGDDQPIYVLCHSGARAASACRRLNEAGVAPAVCVEGGTAAWEKAGLPVERGASRAIPLDRQVRIAAGSLVLSGLALAYLVHPAFLGLSAFVGAGLVFAGVTDFCGMAMLLAKMPWNRARSATSGSCAAHHAPDKAAST
jgi:rhodanese-related sulfurtransferase